jgi:hypothetical protein
MALFSQQFVLETPMPPQEAWKILLPVVKTDQPICSACGQPLIGAAHFCSRCGQPAPPPLPTTWGQRLFSTGGYQFEGTLSPQDFNITRIINYRNCCIPVIRGRFEPQPTGTKIVIEMTMHPLGYVFLIGGTALSFTVLSTLASGGQGLPATALFAFAAPCFIILICWIAFTAEANTARAALSQIWPPAAQV